MPKDALKFAVGIILTIAFLSIVIVLTNKGLSAAKNAEKQYDNMIASTTSEYAIYDGTTVTGSQVVTAINTLRSELNIVVKTRANDAGKTYNASTAYDTSAVGWNTDDTINVNASFKSVLSHNSNGVVDTITFTQQ